jgi:uncharacterized protein YqgC (DUF456 family)
MTALIAWTVAATTSLVGMAGIVLPLLPGLMLIWVGALIHKFCLPSLVSWWTLGAMGVLVLVGTIVEWTAGAAGVKWFGGTRWGMAGAFIGALVGLFFSLPGLIIGPLVGAILAEMLFARRTLRQASTAGAGVAAGWVAATVLKLGLGAAMLVIFWGDALLW